MKDINPAPRIFRCDTFALDLERIIAITNLAGDDDDVAAKVWLVDDDEPFDVDEHADDLLDAWVAYRTVMAVTR